jgi:hypothetical protein
MGGTNDNRKSGAEAAEKMTEAEVKRVTLIKRQRTKLKRNHGKEKS